MEREKMAGEVLPGEPYSNRYRRLVAVGHLKVTLETQRLFPAGVSPFLQAEGGYYYIGGWNG